MNDQSPSITELDETPPFFFSSLFLKGLNTEKNKERDNKRGIL